MSRDEPSVSGPPEVICDVCLNVCEVVAPGAFMPDPGACMPETVVPVAPGACMPNSVCCLSFREAVMDLDFEEPKSSNENTKIHSYVVTPLASESPSTSDGFSTEKLGEPSLQAFGDGTPQTLIGLSTLATFVAECAEGLAGQVGNTFHVQSDGDKVMLDSGSDCHLLSLETAKKLLNDQRPSSFEVVGVSQVPTMVDIEGDLRVAVDDEQGETHVIALGRAYGMEELPLNIVSVPKIVDVGGIVHYETGNSYLKLPRSSSVPLIREKNQFFLPVREVSADADAGLGSSYSIAVSGCCYAVAVPFADWHRRLGHLSLDELATIAAHGHVDGFNVRGKISRQCGCESCRVAKIRCTPTPHESLLSDTPSVIGDVVSVDVKVVPVESFKGHRYMVIFVDHYSRMKFVYFLRHKSEVPETLKFLIRDFKSKGFKLKRVQTDRGTEFFSQEGDTYSDRDRKQSRFTEICEANETDHIVVPTGSHEKLAEGAIKDIFERLNTMLFEPRLSPAFWCDAAGYLVYMMNRTPNKHTAPTTPYTMYTGKRARWDKFKVFGCDVYEHIANNKYAKVPGLPRGRKCIFVGFDRSKNGWKVFDPETRKYRVVENAYFYENFSHRIDALRHHDKRRELMRNGMEQPIVLNDFEGEVDFHMDSVRSIYTSAEPPVLDGVFDNAAAAVTADAPILEGASPAAAAAVAVADVSTLEGASPVAAVAVAPALEGAGQPVERVSASRLRPVRLVAVGTMVKRTPRDNAFLELAEREKFPVLFLKNCPKNAEKAAGKRYLIYMMAGTLPEAYTLGATRDDVRWDYERGFIKFPGHEPSAPGHVFRAGSVDFDSYSVGDSTAGVSIGTPGAFSQAVVGALGPMDDVDIYSDDAFAERIANAVCERVLGKVYAAGVNIDWGLAPEPKTFREVLSRVDKDKWIAACLEEINTLIVMGVAEKVPISEADFLQLLYNMWVFKYKINENGVVTRYRARIVAQGNRQRPGESYDPKETTSPTVSKSSLRTMLAMCAQRDLKVFQADVKAAFLQAPLKERIYMRAPQGFEERTASGEEVVYRLNKAIYGLKQAAACFWGELSAHLVSKGYKAATGESCLFTRKMPDGSDIILCTYVDDITFGVSSDANAALFMAELKERFVIDEGEGKPIKWLLGIAIEQDLAAGKIKMDMELAITKLAEGLLTPEELVKASSVRTPMLITPLSKDGGDVVSKDDFDYLAVVGSLLHVANCVRCDVSYAVGVLSRFAKSPGRAHVKAAKRVVMYLYNTRKLGITYTRTPEEELPVIFEGAKHPKDNGVRDLTAENCVLLRTFADSDYAGDESRKSTMGLVVMMNGGPVAWFSNLGKVVATSTAEAEIYAACAASKEALHVSRLIYDMGYTKELLPIRIAEDNAACIAMGSAGLKNIKKAKHYEVKLRFLQQLILQKKVVLDYCPTDKQLADFFTKPLDESKFVYFRDLILTA